MKQVILTLISVWFIFSSTAYAQDKVDLTNESKFDFNIPASCFDLFSYSGNNTSRSRKSNEIIIRDQRSYENFENSIRNKNPNYNCRSVRLPYIDFSRYILVGKRTEDGSLNHSYSVMADYKNRKIVYTITEIPDNYRIKVLRIGWHLALIPKLNNIYSIEIKVK